MPNGLSCILILLILFGYMSSVMGLTNMLNTIMNTAHDLLLNTVFYLMGMCVVTGALGKVLVEFGVVDPGGEADPTVTVQVGVRDHRGVDQVNAVKCFRDGVQKPLGIAMMLGIVDERCFHGPFSLRFIDIKTILYLKNSGKHADVYLAV